MSDGLIRESWEIGSRAEWLARRRQHVTASWAPVLFDAHPFQTRADLAAEQRGERQSTDTAAMRDGRILEPAVAAAVAEEYPLWRITKATTYHWLPAYRLGCTPDYWLDDDGLIQIKTCSVQTWESWRGTVPLGYIIQTLVELLVTGRTRGYLAIMLRRPGYPLHIREVPRHMLAEGRILEAVQAWWRDADAGRLPAGVPSTEIAADLDDGSHVDLSADNELPGLLAERATLKAGTSETEKRLKVIDDTLRERVGAARSAWLPGWLIRYPTIEASAYSVPARSYRRLDVRPSKEDEPS